MSVVIELTYVDPKAIPWEMFTNIVISNTVDLANQLPVTNEDNWMDWANALCGVSNLAVSPPDPSGYEDWTDWATDLMAAY